MSMTKADFEAVAWEIRHDVALTNEERRRIAVMLGRAFRTRNSRFDQERFTRACLDPTEEQ